MDKQKKMFRLIELWEKSGQSQPDFCSTHGVTVASFGYWRTKWLALQIPIAQPKPSSFIPVEKPIASEQSPSLLSDSVEESRGYEIIYPNGVRFRLPFLDLSVLPRLLSLNVQP